MGLESLYADRIEQGIERDLRMPGPPPAPPSFSVWGMFSALGKAPVQAGLEQSGTVADILSGFATAAAASGGTGQGMFSVPTEQEKQQEAQARERMLKGEAFDTTAGGELRRKADEFAPDPQTTHTANQVIHGVIRGAAKAVGDVATMGPVAGAVAFGLDEGNTAAQRLIAEGVDPATAAKVGATTGAVSGASVALPMVGPTVGKTIGLALLSGPVSYMAQEKAAKEILQRADYGTFAAQHDPLDPLGLGLSIVIPGAVAGLHVRGLRKPVALEDVVKHIESGGQRFGADGKLLTSPKGAQGEMQVMPRTAQDPGFGIAPARDNSPEELARMGRDYLAAMQQRYGDTDKALAAYNAGPGAVDAAVAKHGDAWLKAMPEETQKYVAKAATLMDRYVGNRGAADPATVDAARVRVLDDVMARSLPDHPSAAADILGAADEVGAGRMPRVPEPPGGASIAFEIAPDPNNAALVTRWRALDQGVRQQISQRVMQQIVPRVLEEHGLSGRIASQVGSYLDDTNPSFALRLEPGKGDPLQLAKDMGHIFEQDSMVVLSPKKFDGGEATGAVDIDVGNLSVDELHALYQRLRAIEVDGERPISGQSTIGGRMVVLNFSKVPTERLAQAIDQALDGRYTVAHHDVFTAFPEKSDYGHGSAQGDSAGNASPLRGRADLLRQEAGAALGSELDAAESRAAADLAGRRPADQGVGGSALPPPDRVELEPPTAAKPSSEAPGAGGADQARLKQLLDEQPDMPVRLPGTDQTLSLENALLRAHEAYDDEVHIADLVKIAAECALMSGV